MKRLKQTWMVALVVALTPALAAAQTAVGIRAGVRSAQLETAQSTDGARHLVVGGYFGVGISDRLAIQIEAVYGARGAEGVRVGQTGLDPAADPVGLRMTYLDVPILLRTGFPGQRFLPSLFVGPYAGFLLSCELDRAGTAWSCDADTDATTETARFNPRSTDVGILAGAALDMALGQNTVFVDLRYTVGLLSIMAGGDRGDARHTGFEVTGGFAFPLGRR